MGAARRCRKTSAVSDQACSDCIRCVKGRDGALDAAFHSKTRCDRRRNRGRQSVWMEDAMEIEVEYRRRKRRSAARRAESAGLVAREAPLGLRLQLRVCANRPRDADNRTNLAKALRCPVTAIASAIAVRKVTSRNA